MHSDTCTCMCVHWIYTQLFQYDARALAHCNLLPSHANRVTSVKEWLEPFRQLTTQHIPTCTPVHCPSTPPLSYITNTHHLLLCTPVQDMGICYGPICNQLHAAYPLSFYKLTVHQALSLTLYGTLPARTSLIWVTSQIMLYWKRKHTGQHKKVHSNRTVLESNWESGLAMD